MFDNLKIYHLFTIVKLPTCKSYLHVEKYQYTPSMSYKKPSEKKLVAFLIFLQISYGFGFLEVKKGWFFVS